MQRRELLKGVYLGRWDFQGAPRVHPTAVCVGRFRRECPWDEVALGDRRRRMRINPELAGSPVESESLRDGSARISHWRWGHGILGRCGVSLSDDAAPTVLVPQDEQSY
jgi:hypothetical protein